MTGQQQAVMWLGIALILMRLFTTKQWSEIWGVVGNGTGTATGTVPAPGTAKKPNCSGLVGTGLWMCQHGIGAS